VHSFLICGCGDTYISHPTCGCGLKMVPALKEDFSRVCFGVVQDRDQY